MVYPWYTSLWLRNTGRMGVRRQLEKETSWKYITSCWRRTALWYTIFLVRFRSSQVRFHSDLGNKVISSTFSRDRRELFVIPFVVSKILRFKQTVSNKVSEVRSRRFPTFFDNQNEYSKKLSSVPQQCLCGEYTTKTGLTDSHNFKKHMAKIWTVYWLYLCAHVWERPCRFL